MSFIELSHSSLPYKLTDDLNQFDMETVHRWLSADAYWSLAIPFETCERAFKNSLPFALLTSEGQQVGVARVVSDYATFGYLADVYILPEHRGKGLAKWLVEFILSHPELQGLRRIMLATSDMHELYRKFGFTNVAGNDLLMEIVLKNPYK